MSLRMTDKRERSLREVMQLTGESTKAGALCLHYFPGPTGVLLPEALPFDQCFTDPFPEY